MTQKDESDSTQFETAIQDVTEGLRKIAAHGFGTCKAIVETGKGRKRQIRVETMFSDQFTVPEDQIPPKPAE